MFYHINSEWFILYVPWKNRFSISSIHSSPQLYKYTCLATNTRTCLFAIVFRTDNESEYVTNSQYANGHVPRKKVRRVTYFVFSYRKTSDMSSPKWRNSE